VAQQLALCVAQSVLVRLVDDREEVIEHASDPSGVWKRAISSVSMDQFDSLALLAEVDPYGDTLFKHDRLDQLEREISLLRHAASGEDAAFFDRVQEMIKRAGADTRLGVEFVGD
jgi:hypothetical protein